MLRATVPVLLDHRPVHAMIRPLPVKPDILNGTKIITWILGYNLSQILLSPSQQPAGNSLILMIAQTGQRMTRRTADRAAALTPLMITTENMIIDDTGHQLHQRMTDTTTCCIHETLARIELAYQDLQSCASTSRP